MPRREGKRAYSRLLEVVWKGGLAASLLSGCTSGVEDRITSAYSLAQRPNERNKNRIEALLQDPDRDVRATALVAMNGIDVERATRMAILALQDRDGFVRAAAVSIVGAGFGDDAPRRMASLAMEDPVWHVRSRALEAIASSDDPVVREAFAHALADPVRYVRRTALRLGAEHPGLLPVDLLTQIVASDLDWENRVEAAHALGASKDPAAYPGLDAAVADPNEFVRATAARERRSLEGAAIAR